MRTISVFLLFMLLFAHMYPLHAQEMNEAVTSLKAQPESNDQSEKSEIVDSVNESPSSDKGLPVSTKDDSDSSSYVPPSLPTSEEAPIETHEDMPNGSDQKDSETESHTENSSPIVETTISPILTETNEPALEHAASSVMMEKEDQVETNRKSPLVISEILLETSTSSHEEYVELFNNSDHEIDLKSYRLTKRTSSGTESNLVSTQSFTGIIQPYDFFVIAHQDYAPALRADLSFSGKTFTIAKDSSIILYDHQGATIDLVGFGNAKQYEDSATRNPPKGHSIKRNKDGDIFIDTDDNASDFSFDACPHPGSLIPSNIYNNVRINEVYPRTCTTQDETCPHTEEFIEIHNFNDHPIDLTKWTLHDNSATGQYTIPSTMIDPYGFLTLFKHDYEFSLNDTGNESLTLVNPLCQNVSSISYTNARKGASLNFGDIWYWTTPTPNHENTPDPRTQIYPTLLLTEILPNPSDDESRAEFIEIYNPSDTTVDLKNWTLRDSSSSGIYIFPETIFLAPRAYHVIYRDVFIFALNNTTETLSLIAPNEKIMDYTRYTTSRENISFNFDVQTHTWRWSTHLTPGTSNRLNNMPIISSLHIPSLAHKDTYTDFSAHANDPDHENLKVRWDFGDGRRSYLWHTRHTYLKTGTYHGSVRIQDMSEEIVHNFTITVKKYPRHELRITKIAPNPSGKDTGTEYILLRNDSHHTVDLTDWSIATGTTKKRLANHPLRKKVTIKKNETKMITHDHGAITLPNTTGVIELRRPDGSIADKVSYGESRKTIASDAYYELIDRVWTWTVPIDKTKQQRAHTIIMQAIENERQFLASALEKRIALSKIHAPQKIPIFTNLRSLSIYDHLFHLLNTFLTKNIIEAIQMNAHLLYNASLYTNVSSHININHAHDRCAITPIFDIHKPMYDFCKDHISPASTAIMSE